MRNLSYAYKEIDINDYTDEQGNIIFPDNPGDIENDLVFL